MTISQFSFLSVATCLGIATLAALPKTAQAQTLIYDNGTFATTNAYQITSFATADDFVFGSTQTFDKVRVWLTDTTAPNNTLNTFSGTLSWLIRSNNGGIPGAVLGGNSGTVSGAAITQADTGVDIFGFRIFQLDFSLPSTTLGAGTYWFQIKENGLSDPDDGSEVLWLNAGTSTGFNTKLDNNPVNPTTWTAGGVAENRAFQFYASSGGSAPEPGTFALLALGVVGGIVARRRT